MPASSGQDCYEEYFYHFLMWKRGPVYWDFWDQKQSLTCILFGRKNIPLCNVRNEDMHIKLSLGKHSPSLGYRVLTTCVAHAVNIHVFWSRKNLVSLRPLSTRQFFLRQFFLPLLFWSRHRHDMVWTAGRNSCRARNLVSNMLENKNLASNVSFVQSS